MPPTGTLFDLAVMLHPEHDTARQTQMALLAGRLGYTEVWLPAAVTRRTWCATGSTRTVRSPPGSW